MLRFLCEVAKMERTLAIEDPDKSSTSQVGLTIGVIGMVIFIIFVIVGVAIASSRNNTATGFQTIGAVTNTTPVSGGWSGWTIAGVIVGILVLIVIAGIIIWVVRK